MYRIEYAEGIAEDFALLRAYKRKQILDRLEKQLRYEPTKRTKNRKPLPGLIPPWEYIEPVWELRISEYRVFYDVDEQLGLVMVRAIRHKPPHKTTEEIL
jgi:mRNA-degrading endonuclease RelE of RelBE toxin-antitoxin system